MCAKFQLHPLRSVRDLENSCSFHNFCIIFVLKITLIHFLSSIVRHYYGRTVAMLLISKKEIGLSIFPMLVYINAVCSHTSAEGCPFFKFRWISGKSSVNLRNSKNGPPSALVWEHTALMYLDRPNLRKNRIE